MRELARQLILSGALGLEGGEDVGRRFGIGEEDEREDEEDEEEEQSDGDGDGEGDGDAQADNADDDDDDLQTLDEKAALGTAVLVSISVYPSLTCPELTQPSTSPLCQAQHPQSYLS